MHTGEAGLVVRGVLHTHLLQRIHRLRAHFALLLSATKPRSQGVGHLRLILLQRPGNDTSCDTLHWRRLLLLRLDGIIEASLIASCLREQLLKVRLAVEDSFQGRKAVELQRSLAVRAPEAGFVVNDAIGRQLLHDIHRLPANLAFRLRPGEGRHREKRCQAADSRPTFNTR